MIILIMYTINIFMTITEYRNVEIIMDFKMLIEGHLIWMRWGTWIFENCLVVIVTQELVLKKRVGAITISIFIFNENIKMNIIHKIFKPYVGISLIMDPNLSFEGQNDKHLFLLQTIGRCHRKIYLCAILDVSMFWIGFNRLSINQSLLISIVCIF